jgi:hypothetical protein
MPTPRNPAEGATASMPRKRKTPMPGAKALFMEMLAKAGRLNLTEAKALFDKRGVPGPSGSWTKLHRELEAEGRIRAEKRAGDKMVHYVLTAGWHKIGEVGVGSGQLRIADPCHDQAEAERLGVTVLLGSNRSCPVYLIVDEEGHRTLCMPLGQQPSGPNRVGALVVTSEESGGPTPNGGVRSVIYYQDDDGNPADKSVATRAEIVEYDADGKDIHRTYGTFTRRV